MSRVEFKLIVPCWDLKDRDGSDCAEVREICRELGLTLPPQTLAEQYQFYYDPSLAEYAGDPRPRIGFGDVHLFQSDLDDGTFLAADMFNEATDQFNTVKLGVRCDEAHADRVSEYLRSLHDRAEVASELQAGSLGLLEEFEPKKFPRPVNHHGQIVSQHLSVFRRGALIATSRRGQT